MEMCTMFYLYIFITLTMATKAEVLCSNGAICLSVQNCAGLFNRLKELNQESHLITGVLRRLHCGFDNNLPKICCPPGLQDNSGLDLLPNTTVCGIQMNNRILGGVQTDIDEHPWTVLIMYKKLKGSLLKCGGTLISSKYVLTAAHCFKGYEIREIKNCKINPKLFHVRLGEWNLASRTDCQQDDCSPDPLNVDVEKIILHENYSHNLDKHNDIALVRLVQNVSFTDFVRPICLPIDPTLRGNSFEAYELETSGWGKTETGPTSDIKLKVNLRVTNTEDCRIIYENENCSITDKHLCAGGIEGKDSCRGDSGGALMGQLGATKNWMAVGITSFGPSPCGTTGWPGVYTRVTEYTDWIISTIRP